MIQRALTLALAVIIVVLALGMAGARSAGTERSRLGAPRAAVSLPRAASPGASPGAAPEIRASVPAGVALDLLASAKVDRLPSGRVAIGIERVRLEPGSVVSRRAGGPEVLFVESGALKLDAVEGGGRYGEGTQAFVPAGTTYSMQSEAARAATLLRLWIDPVAAGTPAAVATPATAGGTQVLVGGEVSRLVSRQATMFLARVTVPPGVDAGSQFFSGPVGVAVETGTITVVGSDGRLLDLEPGRSVLIPAYTAYRVRNRGSGPVVALVGGLLAAETSGGVAPTPTATPAVDVLATARAAGAGAAATAAALATRAAALAATVEAQAAEIAGGETAQARAAADTRATAATQAAAARATIDALGALRVAGEASLATTQADLATAQGRAAALTAGQVEAARTATAQSATVGALAAQVGDAQATSGALAATVAAQATAAAVDRAAAATANALATTDAGAAAATVAALATSQAVQATAIGNQASAASSVAAAATAAASEAAAAVATAAGQASAAAVTVAALDATRSAGERGRATAEAQVTAAAATIAALATQQAESSRLATTSLNASYVEESIQVDSGGVVNGDRQATDAARAELRRVLGKYEQGRCRAGVVLTFGHGATIGQGTVLAGALNTLIADLFPTVFGGTAFDAFGDLNQPHGQVDIRLYFFTGCGPAEGTPSAGG